MQALAKGDTVRMVYGYIIYTDDFRVSRQMRITLRQQLLSVCSFMGLNRNDLRHYVALDCT